MPRYAYPLYGPESESGGGPDYEEDPSAKRRKEIKHQKSKTD
ncbi:uncharacterized protein CTRU02_214216 [Colletotrichum truncatum]|uniref:Uncharacterized protein n=1 Tax=Colletotrichum truncatum TaxID=5467 RepID=A0ACC3YHY8_COLTU